MATALIIAIVLVVIFATRCCTLAAELKLKKFGYDALKQMNVVRDEMLAAMVRSLNRERRNSIVTSLDLVGMRILVEKYERIELERARARERN